MGIVFEMVEWRYVTTVYGEQCVIVAGMTAMPQSSVNRLDSSKVADP